MMVSYCMLLVLKVKIPCDCLKTLSTATIRKNEREKEKKQEERMEGVVVSVFVNRTSYDARRHDILT